jgi:endonuclease YncB( thermonuclease family)
MRALRAAAAAILLSTALAGCSSEAPPEPAPEAAVRLSGTVDRVIDGDTLVARVGGERVRVRLLGVDAPETPGGRVPSECYGVEADDATRALLSRGARIELRTDPTQGRRDRFGRLLAEVTAAGEGRTVNEALVAAGAAEVFRGDGRARLLPALRRAEIRARQRRLGLWERCSKRP